MFLLAFSIDFHELSIDFQDFHRVFQRFSSPSDGLFGAMASHAAVTQILAARGHAATLQLTPGKPRYALEELRKQYRKRLGFFHRMTASGIA